MESQGYKITKEPTTPNAANKAKVQELQECLLTIITNISPYVKSLCMSSSIKLLKLFDFLSKPNFIFASERNYRYLFFLLETMINIVEYQYEGNTKLIYAILSHQPLFTRLLHLSINHSNDSKPTNDDIPHGKQEITPNEDNITNKQLHFIPTDEWVSFYLNLF
jgi:hypothetical protein